MTAMDDTAEQKLFRDARGTAIYLSRALGEGGTSRCWRKADCGCVSGVS